MKCPKCGYLGFETTDRCRNCQYDFSLAPFISEPELTLQGADRTSRIRQRFRAAADRAAERHAERRRRSISIGCSAIRSPIRPPLASDCQRATPRAKLEPPTITVLDDDAPDAIEEPIDDAEPPTSGSR